MSEGGDNGFWPGITTAGGGHPGPEIVGGPSGSWRRYGGRRMTAPKFRYSKWDGSQVGFDLDADALLEEITDDLLYHGDMNAALRRMMQQGFKDRNGEQVQGMRDLMERLRRHRRDQLDQYDLGGVYEE